jgi:hypothetical protein
MKRLINVRRDRIKRPFEIRIYRDMGFEQMSLIQRPDFLDCLFSSAQSFAGL